MTNNKKNIDNLFKEKLNNFELAPQDSSWKVFELMDDKASLMKRVFFAKVLLSTVVLLSVSLLLIYSSESPKTESQIKLQYNNAKTSVSGEKHYTINKTPKSLNSKIILTEHHSSSPAMVKHRPVLKDVEKTALDLDAHHQHTVNQIASLSITTYKNNASKEKTSAKRTVVKVMDAPHDVYGAVIDRQGTYMFFTSKKPVTNREKRKGKGKERIYYTETTTSGWTEAQLMENTINAEVNFNSAVALSSNGKSLFIYRDNRFGNGDFYESKLIDSEWSEPKALPYPINSDFHESTLSFSSDGNTVYFTSNREGGAGGMDIWVAKKNKMGVWGEAENLGSTINTAEDEEGVFIHPDGKTLFFSSQGHEGMGGYDIYYTTLENGAWSTPVNLGPDINTENDDIYFILDDEDNAYYTSIDPQSPEKRNIFKVKYTHQHNEKIALDQHSVFEGIILSKDDKTPIEAQIAIYGKDRKELITTLTSHPKTGQFSIPLSMCKDYYIHIYKDGFLFYAEMLPSHLLNNHQIVYKEVYLDQLANNTQFVLKEFPIEKHENAIAKNLQRTLDDLYQLMIVHPHLNITLSMEVNAAKNTDALHHQNTIDQCAAYLKSKGIKANRIYSGTTLNNSNMKSNAKLYVNVINI